MDCKKIWTGYAGYISSHPKKHESRRSLKMVISRTVVRHELAMIHHEVVICSSPNTGILKADDFFLS